MTPEQIKAHNESARENRLRRENAAREARAKGRAALREERELRLRGFRRLSKPRWSRPCATA